MIGPRAGTRVWLAAGITDMRCGIDSLAVKVQATLAEDPYAGHVFAFRGRRGDLIQIAVERRRRHVPVDEASRAGSIYLAAGRDRKRRVEYSATLNAA